MSGFRNTLLRCRRWALVLTCSATLALAGLPGCTRAPADPFGSQEALARARSLREALKTSDAALLWPELDGALQASFGAFDRFERDLQRSTAETGLLEDCEYDLVTRDGEHWLYRADCRFDAAPAPLAVAFAFDDEGRIAGFWLLPGPDAYPSEYLDYQTRTPLRLPFRGEWTVAWGGRTSLQNLHVESRDQRFASDFLVTRDGTTHEGTGRRNVDYFCFGQPILAPADGTVVLAVDHVRDNRPGVKNERQPAGNVVVLDHGRGEFSMLAHFQRGSLQVEVGQRVAEGTVLGRCGNSGNSNEPHLHYNLQNGPRVRQGDSLPAFFLDYLADGQPVLRGEPLRNQRVHRREE